MEKEKLKEFQQILLRMKQDILNDASELSNNFQNGANVQERIPDTNDRASMESDSRLLLRLNDRNRKLILKIEESLKKIKQGSYGVCEICGEEISEERLRLRPVTTQCISCKTELEGNEKLLKKTTKK
ncbi:MAG: RNA polymerase-binding protein DksA [Deltaproteobacteria bacterium]|nr:RNA polymerase-binding protein DksA [Deltaproteobacteria bacterium]MCL5791671.1 RNA polymerase-binding protein DksA [Deltaproteobacteria bacterium]